MTITACNFDDPWCVKWVEVLVASSGWILAAISIVFLSIEISFERKRRKAAHNELLLISTSSRTQIPAYPQARPLSFNPPPPEAAPSPKQPEYPREPVPPMPPSKYPPNAFSYLPSGSQLPERKPSYLSASNRPYVPPPSASRWASSAAPSSSYTNQGYD